MLQMPLQMVAVQKAAQLKFGDTDKSSDDTKYCISKNTPKA